MLQTTPHPPPPPMRDKHRKRKGGPTMAQIISDPLTLLSLNVWAPQIPLSHRCYFPDLINDIYYRECIKTGFSTRRLMVLELSQYLENYLWPHYNPINATHSHVMSIVSMVNEKFREGINPWWVFEQTDKRLFAAFFNIVLNKSLAPEKEVSMREQISILVFLIHCFNSLSVDLVREHVWKLLSFSTWVNLLPSRLTKELHQNPELKKYWSKLQKKESEMDEKSLRKAEKDRKYMYKLFNRYLSVLRRIHPAPSRCHKLDVSYCERFIEMLIDLEAQLPTRRYFNTQLDNSHLIVFSSLAPLVSRQEGKLFSQLLDILKFYAGFEISDHTGQPLTIHNMTDLHYSRIASLQRAAFKNYNDLRDFALSNISAIDTRESLKRHFTPLPYDSLHNIASFLCLVPPLSEVSEKGFQKVFLIEMIVSHHERRISQLDLINQTPLYPDEKILWDENVVPSEYYTGDDCLALPKLNLQFLTLHDYLLRNFQLFKLESTYEIRLDVEDAISRMKPRITPEGATVFHGWARMAQPITSITVFEVGKPNIGETWPSRVRADITLHLNLQQNVRVEWELLRKHDVCFLINVKPEISVADKPDPNLKFSGQVGLLYVRGCEIEGMLDDSGKMIEENQFEPKPRFPGVDRTFRVLLDPNQYQMDINSTTPGPYADIYSRFNIFLRRKPKENNFKAVLDTTRDLMNSDCIVPEWIHNTFLGYGDPGDANYCKLPQASRTFDFKDTFLSLQHLIDSFPQYRVSCTQEDPEKQVPPFRITFPESLKPKLPEPYDLSQMSDIVDNIITVEAHTIPNRGPYPYDQPKFNTILFTPTQTEAIVSGMHEGLTLVVGPPGTGKTDVAVQIISNLYHNFPQQRTLIVTHSNQALNQLFEKIMCLDIQERHLLRLGHGEESLETEKDFSR